MKIRYKSFNLACISIVHNSSDYNSNFKLGPQRIHCSSSTIISARIPRQLSISSKAYRVAQLSLKFGPLIINYPLYCLSAKFKFLAFFRRFYERWLVNALSTSGPLFIKMGQWVSSRPDLFPEHIVACLEVLQSRAPHVAICDSEIQLRLLQSYPFLSGLVESVELIGSGSVACVYKIHTSTNADFAFKVVGKGVQNAIELDLSILSACLSLVKPLMRSNQSDIDQQFQWLSELLLCQTDLECERNHINQFRENFKSSKSIKFPECFPPIDGARDVLLETFEQGVPLADFIKCSYSSESRAAVANTGMDAYMQMVLRDNFVHADLHPGNILVRFKPRGFWSSFVGSQGASSEYSTENCIPELVILDSGLVSGNLSKNDFQTLRNVVSAVIQFDGARLADIFIESSVNSSQVLNPVELRSTLVGIFEAIESKVWFEQEGINPTLADFTDVGLVQSMFALFSKHNIRMPSPFYSVMMSSLLAEGLARSLSETVDIFSPAFSYI